MTYGGEASRNDDRTKPEIPASWLAWASYDLGQRPFNFLVLTYVFAPYFAATLYADPVRGQAVWGLTIAASGVLVALLAPPLGAIADAAGPKKPWIGLFGLLLVSGSAALWWTQPGAPYAIPLAITAIVVASTGSELSIVFHNALLPVLARRENMGRLSALGWAVGVTGGVAALLVVVAAFAVAPNTGMTLGGWPPVFALDPVESTAGRIAGPLVALMFAVAVVPMFVWMPDDRRSEMPLRVAASEGIRGLRGTFAVLRKDRKLATFLIAYLLYSDGLITLVAFGGVYAAGLLGWGPIQLAGLGLALGIAGIPVLLLAGRIDDRIGPQRVVTFCIMALGVSTIGVLGVDKTGLFGVTIGGLHGGHLFLFFAVLIGLSAGPLQSSSRTLMAHLAPRERTAQMFGLLALSGRVTCFAGPILVAVVTAATGSQRLGMSVALVFLMAGAALMLRLRRLESA